MASNLTVAEWKKLVKEHADAVEADAVTKALEAWNKVGPKDDPEAQLDAANALIGKVESAKRKNKKKEVVAYLEKMLKEAEAERQRGSGQKGESEAGRRGERGGRRRGRAAFQRVEACPDAKAGGRQAVRGRAREGLRIRASERAGAQWRAQKACAGDAGRQRQTPRGPLLWRRGKVCVRVRGKSAGRTGQGDQEAVLIHCEKSIKVKVKGPNGEFDDENDIDEMTDLGTDEEGAPRPPPTYRHGRRGDSVEYPCPGNQGPARCLPDVDAGRAAPLLRSLRIGIRCRAGEAVRGRPGAA